MITVLRRTRIRHGFARDSLGEIDFRDHLDECYPPVNIPQMPYQIRTLQIVLGTRTGSSAPSGLVSSVVPSHGLRRGLHSFAAPRLRSSAAEGFAFPHLQVVCVSGLPFARVGGETPATIAAGTAALLRYFNLFID